MATCTAPKTGRHKDAYTRANCPACNPSRHPSSSMMASARPTGMANPAGRPPLDEMDRNDLAGHVATCRDVDTLRYAARMGDPPVVALAKNKATPADALIDLIDRLVRRQQGERRYYIHGMEDLLRHRALTAEVLDDLAHTEDVRRRYGSAIARNPNVSEETLEYLAYGDHWSTQGAAARSRYAPASLLRGLLDHPDDQVKAFAVGNANLPVEEAEAFGVNHPNEIVRIWVADRPGLSQRAIAKLLRDDVRKVRSQAAKNPGLTTEAIRSMLRSEKSGWVVDKLLKHKNVTPEIVEEAARSDVEMTRRYAAVSPHLSWDTLVRLKNDSHAKVRNYSAQSMRKRIPARLGIDPRNHEALDRVFEGDWENYTEDSPEVLLIKAVHR